MYAEIATDREAQELNLKDISLLLEINLWEKNVLLIDLEQEQFKVDFDFAIENS